MGLCLESYEVIPKRNYLGGPMGGSVSGADEGWLYSFAASSSLRNLSEAPPPESDLSQPNTN